MLLRKLPPWRPSGKTRTAMRALTTLCALVLVGSACAAPGTPREVNGNPAADAEQASAAFKAEDYRLAITWAQRHFSDGGNDTAVRALLSRAHYALADFENAARSLHQEIDRAEKAARSPSEDSLKLLVQCYMRLNDISGQTWALERLVTYYPRREHWADAIAAIQKKPEFGHGLMIDVWRLKLATGAISGSGEYLAAAAVAQQLGFLAEAKAALERGFADGTLGSGPDAESHRKLRAQLNQQAAQEKARVAAGGMPVPATLDRWGNALVNAGLACVTLGEIERGFTLINLGLSPPTRDRPQYDKLHLGIARLRAGQMAEAAAVFKTVTGRQGAADLGRLWYLHTLQLRETKPAARAAQ